MPQEDLSKLKIDKAQLAVRSRRSKRFTIGTAIILFVLAAALVSYFAFFARAQRVEVGTVSIIFPSQTFTLLNASGYAVAQRKAAVASKVTGRLVELSVEEGSPVRKGEIIARLENADAEAVVEQARANVRVARFNVAQTEAELEDAALALQRVQKLISEGFASQQNLDVAEARHRKAAAAVAGAKAAERASAAALEAAEVALDYTYIRAPFDAMVLTKNADMGDIVTPIGAAADAKAAVVTIADMDSLQVEVDVSESNLSSVKVGQPCEIQLDALGEERFPGTVHMIVPTADRSKATVLVKVRFDKLDPRVLPEMSAKVAFLSRAVSPEEASPRTVVPPMAVIERSGKTLVYRIRETVAVETPIRVGERLGDMVEVEGGIQAGSRVVLNPPRTLNDGDRIKIIEK